MAVMYCEYIWYFSAYQRSFSLQAVSQKHDCLLVLISQLCGDSFPDNVKFRLPSEPRSFQHGAEPVPAPLCAVHLPQHPPPAGKGDTREPWPQPGCSSGVCCAKKGLFVVFKQSRSRLERIRVPRWGELLPVCLNKYLWGGFFCFVLPSLPFININVLVLSLVSDGLNKFSRGSVPKLLLGQNLSKLNVILVKILCEVENV